jgi:hypothetical protein
MRAPIFGARDAASCETLQIGPRAERAAFPPEDGDVRRVVGVESDESVKVPTANIEKPVPIFIRSWQR